MNAHMISISGIVTACVAEANNAYLYRKLRRLWQYNKLLDQSLSATAAKELADSRVSDEYQEELIHRYIADYLEGKYRQYEKYISTLQSRMGILRHDMFRSNLPNPDA